MRSAWAVGWREGGWWWWWVGQPISRAERCNGLEQSSSTGGFLIGPAQPGPLDLPKRTALVQTWELAALFVRLRETKPQLEHHVITTKIPVGQEKAVTSSFTLFFFFQEGGAVEYRRPLWDADDFYHAASRILFGRCCQHPAVLPAPHDQLNSHWTGLLFEWDVNCVTNEAYSMITGICT